MKATRVSGNDVHTSCCNGDREDDCAAQDGESSRKFVCCHFRTQERGGCGQRPGSSGSYLFIYLSCPSQCGQPTELIVPGLACTTLSLLLKLRQVAAGAFEQRKGIARKMHLTRQRSSLVCIMWSFTSDGVDFKKVRLCLYLELLHPAVLIFPK